MSLEKQGKGMPPTRVRATNLRSGGQGSSPAALDRAKKLAVLASASLGKPLPGDRVDDAPSYEAQCRAWHSLTAYGKASLGGEAAERQWFREAHKRGWEMPLDESMGGDPALWCPLLPGSNYKAEPWLKGKKLKSRSRSLTSSATAPGPPACTWRPTGG